MYIVANISMAQMEFFGIEVLKEFSDKDSAYDFFNNLKDKKNSHPWSGDTQTHVLEIKDNKLNYVGGGLFKDGYGNHFRKSDSDFIIESSKQ